MNNENSCPPQREVSVQRDFFDVNIRKVENGFVLQFGCKTFVAQNWEEASTGIAEYWKDPRGTQKKYSR